MYEYNSPIEILYERVQHEVDNEIFRAVQGIGINVNKEELIKALAYDRDQYQKGFQDGKAERNRIAFLFFDKRRQLANCFYEWCEKNNALNSPFNVISFLAGKDLINIDKALDYLQEAQDEDFLHNI